MGPEQMGMAPRSASLQLAEQTLHLVLSSGKWDTNPSVSRLWCGLNGLAVEGAGSSLSLRPSLAKF